MELLKLWPATCYESDSMKALTITLTFETAQFRKQLVKLYRDTYLIPPPSAVLGMVGAMLGIKRYNLRDFACEKGIMTGAMLLSYEGTISEVETLIKMKNWRKLIRTPKRSVMLYKPTYKIAIASPVTELIEEVIDRAKRLSFEYEVYGGNDYHFLTDLGAVRKASYSDKMEEAYGYCRLGDLQTIQGNKGRAVIQLDSMNDGKISKYAFGFGVPLKVREPKPGVDDEEHRIFIHKSWEFLR